MGADQSTPSDAAYGTSAVGRRASRKKSKRESTYSGFGPGGMDEEVYKQALEEALQSGGDDMNLIPGLMSMSSKQLMKLEAFVEKRSLKLKETITKLSQNDNQGFIDAYSGISAGLGSACNASRIPENKQLNRYNNIVAYDHSRVKVKKTEFNGKNDYVNANWINGELAKNTYIASQGPVPQAFPAFWQMVWEYKVEFIVMVTGEVEGGKLKCHRYWPNAEEGTIQFGGMSLSQTYQEVHPTYVSRHFSMSNLKTGETRELTQYAYTAWPDHGVPSTTRELLNFRRIIREAVADRRNPVLVHCSAGVGRTGTFIGMDRFIQAVLALKDVAILDVVKDMRKSRNFMVQSQIQFMYLFLVSLDALERMAKALKKQRIFGGMTDAQIQEVKLQEMANELSRQEEAVAAINHQAPRRKPSKASGNAPQRVRHGESHHKDDLHKAKDKTLIHRLQSAAESTQEWAMRENVPMGAHEHGYLEPEAPGLHERLSALVVSKDQWLNTYEDAREMWKVQQDENENYYNIEEEMSPLMSRLQSLSMAETAWLYRGDGLRSAKEADARENLASLTQRLESLHSTIVSDEARWRRRGDGFRQEADTAAEASAHTADSLGPIMARLMSLQKDTQAWVDREEHTSTTSYKGEDTFHADRKAERKRQEETRKAKVKKEEDMFAKMRAKREAEEKAEREAEAKRKAEDAERKRKEAIKSRMKAASEVQEAFVSPAQIRIKEEAAKKKAQEEAAQRQREEAAAAQAAARAKQEKAEAIKKKNEGRSNRFLKKMAGDAQ